MSSDSSSPSNADERRTPPERFPVKAGQVLRARAVWVLPLVAGTILVALMTVFYIGSVVDPLSDLQDLPVGMVNQDRAVAAGSQSVDFGQRVQQGLQASPGVSSRLKLEVSSLAAAEQVMDRDGAYAAVVIPPGFTASLLAVSGQPVAGTAHGKPQIEILTNPRAGNTGVNLATAVLQPALRKASLVIGQQLTAHAPATGPAAADRAFLADPVTVTSVQYRPLPSNTALGLSAYYMALLTMLAGFLVGIIVQSSVDVALGYAPNEVGPRWHHSPPLPINRWQTLIIKWVIVAIVTGLLTAVILVLAAGALDMDAPNAWLLWLDMWLCAASVSAGTIVFLAVLGTPGQLLAILVFVYAGLASAGGTVPLEALPPVFRTISQVEPLRQILSGTRAILYFDARSDAGLTRGLLAAGLGLLFWLIAGTGIIRWYDYKGLDRIKPDLLAYIRSAFQNYRPQRK